MTTTIQPTRQALRVHRSHLATTHRAPLVQRRAQTGAASGSGADAHPSHGLHPHDPRPPHRRDAAPPVPAPRILRSEMSTTAPPTTRQPEPSVPRPVGANDRAARRGAIGLGVVLVAQLMLVLDATVVNVALPHIQTDLGFTAAGLSWVLNAYTLAFGGLLLLGGRLGDVFGRLRTFEIGLAIFTVASLLGGLAHHPGVAHRGAHPSGRRRRARRAERARPRDDERPERGRPQPRSRPLHAPCRPPARPSACSSAVSSPTSSAGTGRSSSTCRSAPSCSSSRAAT